MKFVLKNISIYFLLGLSIIGCYHDNEIGRHTYDGFLYRNCQKEPFANFELNFYKVKAGSLVNPSGSETFLGSTFTDEFGFYSFTSSCSKIEVRDASGKVIFGRSCSGTNVITAFEKTANPRTIFPIKILTDSAYTSLDTLYLYSSYFSSTRFKHDTSFVGPFVNNQIMFTDSLFISTSHANLVVGDTIISGGIFYWGLGMEQFNKVKQMKPPYSPLFYKTDLSRVICGFGDTLFVDLRGQ